MLGGMTKVLGGTETTCSSGRTTALGNDCRLRSIPWMGGLRVRVWTVEEALELTAVDAQG